MALVLRPKTDRKGNIKRLDVVRATEDNATVGETVADIEEGQYTVQAAGKVHTVDVSYRTVQDVKIS